MKINQTKSNKDINIYFQQEIKKVVDKHGFSQIEMIPIDNYARERQELLNKCGDRMRYLKDIEK